MTLNLNSTVLHHFAKRVLHSPPSPQHCRLSPSISTIVQLLHFRSSSSPQSPSVTRSLARLPWLHHNRHFTSASSSTRDQIEADHATTSNRSSRRWTEAEDLILLKSLSLPRRLSVNWLLSELPDRSQRAILIRRYRLQNKQPVGRSDSSSATTIATSAARTATPWTYQEDRIILDSLKGHDSSARGSKQVQDLLPKRTFMAIQARREILRRRYAIKTQSTGWTLEELTRLKTLALDQGLKAHEMLPLFPNRSWGAIRKQSWKMVVSNMAETKVKDKDNESKDFDNNDNKNINENVQARSKSEKTVPTPPVYRPTRARSWSTEEDHQILQEFDRFQKEKGGAWTLNELATELSKDLSLARSKLMLLERICRILPKAEIASRRDQATDMMEESRSRSQSHAWTAAEDRALVAAVEEQVGPNYAPRLSYLGQTSLVTRPHKGGHESQDKQRPFLTPNCEALERIDWHKIEGQLETRTWSAARTRFYESLSIRKLDRWSTDEVKRLKEALAKHGFDSMALHRDLVVRSPHQCAHKLYSLHRYLRKTKE